jgi:hypothetical protein
MKFWGVSGHWPYMQDCYFSSEMSDAHLWAEEA